MATTAVRCTREEDERLHVRTAAGRHLGWYDLRTGTTQVLDPDPGAAAEVQAAVDAWVAASSPLRRRRPVDALATRPPAPRARPAEDGPRPEDLRDRIPGEHVTRLLLARVRPAERRWWPAAPDPLGPALRHAHQAVLGQQRVAEAVAPLVAQGWHVLHAVPVSSRSWLDHLLVGPGGLVVLRTAAHPGEAVRITGSIVRAGGRPVSHVRLLRRQCRTVAERLRGTDLAVPVRGVVVAAGVRQLHAGDLPAGVAAVRLEDLRAWLTDLPTVLSRVDVSRLAGTAARPGTWPAEADLPAGAEDRRQRREADREALDRLTARTRAAGRTRRTRRALVLAGAGAGASAVLAALQPDVLPHAVTAVGMIGG